MGPGATARDLLAELKWIAAGGAAATAIMQAPTVVRRRSDSVLPAAAVVALALAAVLAVPAYSYFQGPPPPQETRFRIWPNPYLPRASQTGWFDLSTDGSTVVYRGDQQGINDAVGLYVGRLGELAIRRLPGTDLAAQPFLSPDASDVAFLLDDRLMRLRIAGGQPEEIARVKNMFGGTWAEDGTILLGSSEGIYRVSSEGGRPEIVIPKAGAEAGLYWPRVLPGGRRFLYLSWASAESARAIMMGSLDGAPPVKILSASSNAAFANPGWLIFQRADTVFAQRFDPEAVQLSGDPVRLAGGVWFTTSNGLGAFSVSRNGDLLFEETSGTAASSDHELRRWQPVWLDQTGLPRPVGSVQIYRGAEISPDGSRIAMHRHGGEGGDVWITEPSGTETRLTYEPARDNSSPIWSPDGQHIVFGAFKDGKWGLYRRLSDGRGTEEVLHESERVATPMSWSKDGQRIVFGLSDGGTNGDLWVLTLESSGGPVSKTVKPEAFAATPANETHGQISPDGRWLAYASDETVAGTYEVYVRPFPAGAGRWQVSTTGGDWPRWSRGAQRLLFLTNVGENQTSQGATLHKVDYTVKGDTFVPQPPAGIVTMRALNLSHRGGDFSTYAVDNKGTLLVFTLAQSPTAAQTRRPDQESGLTVVRFWQSALKRR